jgi:hypothetical protein
LDINDPTVISYERVQLPDAIENADARDGDLLLAYSVAPDGNLSPNALILTIDPYGENDDEFLFFDGRAFVWEMDFHTLRDGKRSVTTQRDNYSKDDLVRALKHYIDTDAFIEFPH